MLSGSSRLTRPMETCARMRVIRNAGTSNTDGMYHGYANRGNSAPTRLFGAGATSNGLYVCNFSQIYGSARSPIFYDSDDTSKYTNPAGNSILRPRNWAHQRPSGYSLRVGSIQSANGSIDYLNQVHFNDNLRFYDEGNNNYLNFKYGASDAGGIKFRNETTQSKAMFIQTTQTSAFCPQTLGLCRQTTVLSMRITSSGRQSSTTWTTLGITQTQTG